MSRSCGGRFLEICRSDCALAAVIEGTTMVTLHWQGSSTERCSEQ
ncbi:MAG: hypothetical protein ACPHF4_11495 [Rubripirellula sp.]